MWLHSIESTNWMSNNVHWFNPFHPFPFEWYSCLPTCSTCILPPVHQFSVHLHLLHHYGHTEAIGPIWSTVKCTQQESMLISHLHKVPSNNSFITQCESDHLWTSWLTSWSLELSSNCIHHSSSSSSLLPANRLHHESLSHLSSPLRVQLQLLLSLSLSLSLLQGNQASRI